MLIDERIGFDFHQHLGIDECLDLDHRRRRTYLGERFAVRSPDVLPVVGNVDHIQARSHNVLEACARLRQRRFDILQCLLRLRVGTPTISPSDPVAVVPDTHT
jgi:hypothetical protein